MAEIHPNDIGLATYEDVGDVTNLKTTAKKIVDAINELMETGGGGEGIGFEQIYVDGENNVIIGENNIVYGNNNLIIGSDNVIVADNLNIISNGQNKHISFSGIYPDSYDSESNYISYYEQQDAVVTLKEGDNVVFILEKVWATEDYSDYVYVRSDLSVAKIVSVDEENLRIYIDGKINISNEAPDTTHTVEMRTSISNIIPLADEYKVQGVKKNMVIGSGTAVGDSSLSVNSGKTTGKLSFSANSATANGENGAGVNRGKVDSLCGFAANSGNCLSQYSSAFNTSLCYSPYSLSSGYYSKTYGRMLICESLDKSNKKLTVAEGQNISGITGCRIFIRCYNSANPVVFREATVQSVSGNVLTLTDVTFSSELFFPTIYAFVIDTNTSYSSGNFAGGYYSVASNKFSACLGMHMIAAADGCTALGKYGILTDEYSLALGNGTSLSAPGLAFKVLTDGSVHADGEYTTPCADYAEFFEWDDGNPDNEDRTGYFVKLKGDKITKCDEFDAPLGIVSATPAIIGDSGEMHWKDKFLTDDFGRVQYHDVIVPAELDEEGKVIIEEHIETQPVINPDWNNEETYIPRSKRKEWSPVGVLGKLIVYDDGTLTPGDICRPGKGGIAVKSVKNGYQVLRRVSNNKVLIWFYPTGHEKG